MPGLNLLGVANDWSVDEGKLTTRAEVAEAYGGATQGGIQPSRSTPNVMVYTDPVEGKKSGYNYDGWDANDRNVFYYTGEGANGDQELRVGNKALLEHESAGRTLRLFKTLPAPPGGGPKVQRYEGEFCVDLQRPYRFEPAPGRDGIARKVIVFRLIRVGTQPLAVEPAPPVMRGGVEEWSAPRPPAVSSEAPIDDDPRGLSDVELVDPEDNRVEEYEIAPRAGTVARRDEGRLVRQFEAHLRSHGHELQRARISITGERGSLVSDTFDVTDQTLYEAKSGVDRATVRLGVGQLMDYLRFMPGVTGALLLPAEPSADLKALIRSCGFGVTYRRLGSWVAE